MKVLLTQDEIDALFLSSYHIGGYPETYRGLFSMKDDSMIYKLKPFNSIVNRNNHIKKFSSSVSFLITRFKI